MKKTKRLLAMMLACVANSQNIIGLLYTGDIMLFDINSNGDSIYVLGTDNQYWGYGVMQSGANTGNRGYVNLRCLDIYVA